MRNLYIYVYPADCQQAVIASRLVTFPQLHYMTDALPQRAINYPHSPRAHKILSEGWALNNFLVLTQGRGKVWSELRQGQFLSNNLPTECLYPFGGIIAQHMVDAWGGVGQQWLGYYGVEVLE